MVRPKIDDERTRQMRRDRVAALLEDLSWTRRDEAYVDLQRVGTALGLPPSDLRCRVALEDAVAAMGLSMEQASETWIDDHHEQQKAELLDAAEEFGIDLFNHQKRTAKRRRRERSMSEWRKVCNEIDHGGAPFRGALDRTSRNS